MGDTEISGVSGYAITKSGWGTLTNKYFEPAVPNRDLAVWNQIKKENEMAKGTRKLYNVYVVDPEGDGKVIFKKKEIIATSIEVATRKAVHEAGKDLVKDLDDYDFIVEDVGDMGAIRPKA